MAPRSQPAGEPPRLCGAHPAQAVLRRQTRVLVLYIRRDAHEPEPRRALYHRARDGGGGGGGAHPLGLDGGGADHGTRAGAGAQDAPLHHLFRVQRATAGHRALLYGSGVGGAGHLSGPGVRPPDQPGRQPLSGARHHAVGRATRLSGRLTGRDHHRHGVGPPAGLLVQLPALCAARAAAGELCLHRLAPHRGGHGADHRFPPRALLGGVTALHRPARASERPPAAGHQRGAAPAGRGAGRRRSLLVPAAGAARVAEPRELET